MLHWNDQPAAYRRHAESVSKARSQLGGQVTNDTSQSDELQVCVSLWECVSGTGRVSHTLRVRPHATIADVIGVLSELLERDLRSEILQPGKFLLLVNGTYHAVPRHLARFVVDGDRLDLVPPLSGG